MSLPPTLRFHQMYLRVICRMAASPWNIRCKNLITRRNEDVQWLNFRIRGDVQLWVIKACSQIHCNIFHGNDIICIYSFLCHAIVFIFYYVFFGSSVEVMWQHQHADEFIESHTNVNFMSFPMNHLLFAYIIPDPGAIYTLHLHTQSQSTNVPLLSCYRAF